MGIFSKVFGNKSSESDGRFDSFLPYNLRIGNYLDIRDEDLRVNGLMSLYSPPISDFLITGVSKYKLNYVNHANIYMKDSEGKPFYLQVTYDENKKIDSALLFNNYDNVYPESEAEWEQWIGGQEKDAILGDDAFVIKKNMAEYLVAYLKKYIPQYFPEYDNWGSATMDQAGKICTSNIVSIVSENCGKTVSEVFEKLTENLKYVPFILSYELSENNLLLVTFKEYNSSFIISDGESLIHGFRNINETKELFEYSEQIYDKSSHTQKVSHIPYGRYVEREFFDEEILNIRVIETSEQAYISIDIGIPISVDRFNILL